MPTRPSPASGRTRPATPPTTPTSPDPTPAPVVDPHADTEVARLASSFQDRTVTAIALARVAEAGDDPTAHRRAARAALDAGRPAHARRLIARAQELDPDHPEHAAVVRDADSECKAAGRAVARGGEIFCSELYSLLFQARAMGLDVLLLSAQTTPELVELVGDIARKPGQVCGLDLLNLALARAGAGGIALEPANGGACRCGGACQWPDGVCYSVGVRRIQQRGSKESTAALLAQVEAEGRPCDRCGAPRWSFAHDPDHGEFCAVCAWPLAPATLASHRRRCSHEQLEVRVRGLEAERDEAHEGRDAARAHALAQEGKVAKLGKKIEAEQRQRQQLVAGGAGQASLAELTIEELQAAAAGATARAQASAAQVDVVAVEIARRAGQGAPQG